MERVYHYTSIEVLKLILQNSTIRFRRFDLMDDQTETEGLPNILKKKYFLSCWVCDEKEKIPQWAMYAPEGVRIELPLKWYKKYPIPLDGGNRFVEKIPVDEDHDAKDMFFPLPFSEWFKSGQKFCFIPPLDEREGFMLRVEYSEYFSNFKQQFWKEKTSGDGISLLLPSAPVKYKDSYWSFQNEFRYYLFGTCRPEDHNEIPEFIDIPIDENAFKQIKIRTYPNCSIKHWSDILDVFSYRFPTLDSSRHLERSILDGKYKSKTTGIKIEPPPTTFK